MRDLQVLVDQPPGRRAAEARAPPDESAGCGANQEARPEASEAPGDEEGEGGDADPREQAEETCGPDVPGGEARFDHRAGHSLEDSRSSGGGRRAAVQRSSAPKHRDEAQLRSEGEQARRERSRAGTEGHRRAGRPALISLEPNTKVCYRQNSIDMGAQSPNKFGIPATALKQKRASTDMIK